MFGNGYQIKNVMKCDTHKKDLEERIFRGELKLPIRAQNLMEEPDRPTTCEVLLSKK